MIIIPAIDIRNGNCVRLLQGDPDKETVYSNNPVEMAKSFEDMGAQLIHVVDLDGAFNGEPVNMETVKKIAQSVSIPIEIGGGIRNVDTINKYLDAGIKRIILGTVVVNDEFNSFLERYSHYIIAGIDAKDSMVATHGWKNLSSMKALDFIIELQRKGVREIIYTDISTDGMLSGPNYQSLEKILHNTDGLELIASGGVSSIEDIKELSRYEDMGLKGCIVGKAIYDGRIQLDNAIAQFV